MKDHSAALAAKRQELLESGVEMLDPASVYVEETKVSPLPSVTTSRYTAKHRRDGLR